MQSLVEDGLRLGAHHMQPQSLDRRGDLMHSLDTGICQQLKEKVHHSAHYHLAEDYIS